MAILASFVDEELSREYTDMARTDIVYDTSVVGNSMAIQQRNSNRYDGLRQYTIDFGGLSASQKAKLAEFFITKRGRAIGFRFWPPFDRSFEHDIIGVGDGTTTEFYLKRNYFGRDGFYSRRIVKPIHPYLTVTEDGEKAQILDPGGTITPAGDYPVSTNPITVDWNIGKIEYTAPPAAGALIIVEQGEFNVPVYFDSDALSDSDFGTFSNAEGVVLIEMLPSVITTEGNALPSASLMFDLPLSNSQVFNNFDVSFTSSGIDEVSLYLDGVFESTSTSDPTFPFTNVPRPVAAGEGFEVTAVGTHPTTGQYAIAKIALLSLVFTLGLVTYSGPDVTYGGEDVTYPEWTGA